MVSAVLTVRGIVAGARRHKFGRIRGAVAGPRNGSQEYSWDPPPGHFVETRAPLPSRNIWVVSWANTYPSSPLAITTLWI